MTRRAALPRTRADFHQARGVLLVVRQPPPAPPQAQGQPPAVHADPADGVEVLLAAWDDASVTALHGHVDLGTGLRTALAQIVAEELDLALADVHLLMGHTAAAPNQGATIASASIQLHAAPLRAAAAQAAAWLRNHRLQADDHVLLTLDLAAPVKDVAAHRIVGTSAPRVDIAAKATGALAFVHDMRLPGMLHGRVVRPPYAGADHGDFIGNTLLAVDETSVAHIPGVRKIVVIRDFVGIVTEREDQAEAALAALRVHWKPWPGLPPVADTEAALRANPATPRRLVDDGDVDAATAAAALPMARTYLWPYQLHASIGPSCALASWHGDRHGDQRGDQRGDPRGADEQTALTVWAGTQNPHLLRADIARLLGLPDAAVDIVRMEAAGCYGRNSADDVAADAALLSRAAGAPVRVQLTRAQEHAWEPKGAAQWMRVQGGLHADGSIAAWDFDTAYPSNGAPTLALLLTRSIEPTAQALEMGDRSARPPYALPSLRVTVHDMAPILRAAWLRGVSALPNVFAHESYIDELASAAAADPVAYRLRHLGQQDPRAAELLQATAQRAGWLAHTAPQQQPPAADGLLRGQGVAYARYSHSKWPGYGAAWAAWVADVEVNRLTGEVHVTRVVVGHDAGMLVNPAGVQHQVHGNVLQTTSRALKERVEQDVATGAVLGREWGSYPILGFREVPLIQVLQMPRQGEPALGAGESASVPGTAAIANAIFDATGVRLRAPPFTPEVVRAGLGAGAGTGAGAGADHAHPGALPSPEGEGLWLARAGEGAGAGQGRLEKAGVSAPRPRSLWAIAAALATATLSLAASLFTPRPAIAPIAQADLSLYTPAALHRGRVLAAAGHCAECHTAPGGSANAGGRAIATPFGTLHSTNLTPDRATGIGAWSLAAFTRALRHGISRDGHHLYPAFPYTAFAKLSDDDISALYAHLMAQAPMPTPMPTATPTNTLRWPFNQRPLLALWNALFHDPRPYQPEPARSAEWNRGAELITGIGHCGACHTPRNALGAERSGAAAFLAGGRVNGWEAQPLTAISHAPVAWTQAELYRYLRHGHTQQHGSAAGPMAAVVRDMQAMPNADVQAIAVYLASFNPAGANVEQQAEEQAAAVLARAAQTREHSAAQRLFDSACGACHHSGNGPDVFGMNLPLALNSNLHSPRPDNLLRVVLHGIHDAPTAAHGFMPAFSANLSDAQLADLAAHMRRRFAPGQPPWKDLAAVAASIRTAP